MRRPRYRFRIATPGKRETGMFHGVLRDDDAIEGWLWRKRRTIKFSCTCGWSGEMSANAWWDELNKVFLDLADKHETSGNGYSRHQAQWGGR